MLLARDSTQDKRPTQIESEWLETIIPSKGTGKKSRGSNTHIRQNRLQIRAINRDPEGCLLYTSESERLETNFTGKWIGKKKTGVAILISDKIDFQRRAIKRDPEGHFIMLKGRIQQEDINIVCSQHRSTQIH